MTEIGTPRKIMVLVSLNRPKSRTRWILLRPASLRTLPRCSPLKPVKRSHYGVRMEPVKPRPCAVCSAFKALKAS